MLLWKSSNGWLTHSGSLRLVELAREWPTT